MKKYYITNPLTGAYYCRCTDGAGIEFFAFVAPNNLCIPVEFPAFVPAFSALPSCVGGIIVLKVQ